MSWVAIWLLIDIAGVNASSPDHLDIVEAASSYDWPVVEALSVAWCESQFNRHAYNGFDSGAWQINQKWWKDIFGRKMWGGRFQAHINAEMAYHIWGAGGRSFRWWSCGSHMRR
jgi:hypothetical protein